MYVWYSFIGIIWCLYLVILLPLFIYRQKQRGNIKAVAYKLTLSGVFCLVGLMSAIINNFDSFSFMILVGLIFSMMGDRYLVYIITDTDKFIRGIIFFGAAQICYITAIFLLVGFHLIDVLIALVIYIPLWIIISIRKSDLGAAGLPLTYYIFLVIIMTVMAVGMLFIKEEPLIMQGMFSAGALLFLISDTFLGIGTFLKRREIYSYLVYICYFTGQLMIATAVLFG